MSNTLGAGFLERVYENALAHELRKAGSVVEQQKGIVVRYDGIVVGEYVADLVLDQKVIVEVKTAKALDNSHVAQCLNYLRATGMKVSLLINFGQPKVEVKRVTDYT